MQNVTKKNLLGAFLGGILGILSFGYFHPAALIPGVAVGVLTGFWHDKIWQECQNVINKNLTKSLTWSKTFRPTTPVFRPNFHWVKKIVDLVISLAKMPHNFKVWLNDKPLNKVRFVYVLVNFFYIAIHGVFISQLPLILTTNITIAPAIMILLSMALSFMLFGAIIAGNLTNTISLTNYDLSEEEYHQLWIAYGCYSQSPIRYF